MYSTIADLDRTLVLIGGAGVLLFVALVATVLLGGLKLLLASGSRRVPRRRRLLTIGFAIRVEAYLLVFLLVAFSVHSSYLRASPTEKSHYPDGELDLMLAGLLLYLLFAVPVSVLDAWWTNHKEQVVRSPVFDEAPEWGRAAQEEWNRVAEDLRAQTALSNAAKICPRCQGWVRRERSECPFCLYQFRAVPLQMEMVANTRA